jgi:hypothetical protein
MTAAEFAQRLTGVARRGREWRADCPRCHQSTLSFRDMKHSLSVECTHARSDLGEHEMAVMGCSLKEILGALGLIEVDILSEAWGRALRQQFGGDDQQAQQYLDDLREQSALRARSPRGVRIRQIPPADPS